MSKPEASVNAAASATASPNTRVCVCLEKIHASTLTARCQYFNIGVTAVIKLLLEIEARDALVAKEVALRLNHRGRRPAPVPTT